MNGQDFWVGIGVAAALAIGALILILEHTIG